MIILSDSNQFEPDLTVTRAMLDRINTPDGINPQARTMQAVIAAIAGLERRIITAEGATTTTAKTASTPAVKSAAR